VEQSSANIAKKPKLVVYIQAHLHEEVTLAELANITHSALHSVKCRIALAMIEAAEKTAS
jgi:cysteine synthase